VNWIAAVTRLHASRRAQIAIIFIESDRREFVSITVYASSRANQSRPIRDFFAN
jgi:hypothetical protein